MIDVEQIENMDIEKIKSNFSSLMNTIVTTYEDDKEEKTRQEESDATTK